MLKRKKAYLESITRSWVYIGNYKLKPFRKVAISSLEEGYKKYYDRKKMRYIERDDYEKL